jgi:hypothetical protein
MEQRTIEHLTRIALRLVGVIAVFVSVILATHTVLQLLAAHSVTSGQGLPPGMSGNLKGMAGRVGAWAIAGHVATMVWGVLLVAFSRMLASAVAGE